MPVLAEIRIGVIGLGYVGLPLAVYLARHFPVLGFDIDRERVAELTHGLDRTRERAHPHDFVAEVVTYGPMANVELAKQEYGLAAAAP